jgi:transcriptional regulator with XRE-family HTH domain
MPTSVELRQTRKTLGLTQAALAERLGVSANTVARWERGKLAIDHPAMLALALQTLLNHRDTPTDPANDRHGH